LRKKRPLRGIGRDHDKRPYSEGGENVRHLTRKRTDHGKAGRKERGRAHLKKGKLDKHKPSRFVLAENGGFQSRLIKNQSGEGKKKVDTNNPR